MINIKAKVEVRRRQRKPGISPQVCRTFEAFLPKYVVLSEAFSPKYVGVQLSNPPSMSYFQRHFPPSMSESKMAISPKYVVLWP